jgi:hypothetical protein
LGGALRNLAIKFAVLTSQISAKKPDSEAYLDLSPLDMLKLYKACLSREQRSVLLFAFSDNALLAIVDEEFELEADRPTLLFRKTFLDARSIHLAGIGEEGPSGFRLTVREQALMEHAAIRLLEATRSLYRHDISDERLEDIRQEYEENIRSYLRRRLPGHHPDKRGASKRMGPAVPEPEAGGLEMLLRALMASDKALRAFCHALTADAIFKTDAARLLFGEGSAYAEAWKRKQIFRHMIAQSLQGLVSGCVIE